VGSAPGRQAEVVVRIPTPWYAPRFLVRRKFREALPEYEAIEAIDAKYFSISDDGRFGGLYLWRSRGEAESHFDTAWRQGVLARRGAAADVLLFDVPFVVSGRAMPRGEPLGARSVEARSWASLVVWELPEGADVGAKARSLTDLSWTTDPLIRASIVTRPHSVGIVALWATREAAEAAVAEPVRNALGAQLGSKASEFSLFEVPLLVDASLRDGAP
jgi:hypothetical protein